MNMSYCGPNYTPTSKSEKSKPRLRTGKKRQNAGKTRSLLLGALRRLLESASIPCPNECGATVAVGNMKDHNRTCPKQPMDCKFCNETFISNNFMGTTLSLLYLIFRSYVMYITQAEVPD